MLFYLQLIENEADRKTFEQIYRKFRNLVFWRARGITNNDDLAEDAAQDTWLAAIPLLGKLADMNDAQRKAFLCGIAAHKAVDCLRREHREYAASQEEPLAAKTELLPDGSLEAALARVPRRYQEVLLLRFEEDFSTLEIAQMYQMERSSVQRLLSRAREALRKAWEEENR